MNILQCILAAVVVSPLTHYYIYLNVRYE